MNYYLNGQCLTFWTRTDSGSVHWFATFYFLQNFPALLEPTGSVSVYLRNGDSIRTWKMQPLPVATIAGLLPNDIDRRFYDDRLEKIPYDEPTDLVLISVETYTAKRAYQIASEYRKRNVPVVMGGFHATLCTEEVCRYAETVVVGEAEETLPKVIDDYRHGTPEKLYRSESRPGLERVKPDRSIFKGKRYLPMGLIEFARGCEFKCDFCAIQSYFNATQDHRPIDAVLEEIKRVKRRGQMIFFVDDNICSNLEAAKAFMRALIPLNVRWVSQSSITAAWDEEALDLLKRSGCQGLLIGLESLNESSLRVMNKGFNLMKGGPAEAMDNFRRHGLRIYGTFVFGYDGDTPETLRHSVQFAKDQGLFIAAFNHITPFPGTPLYERLRKQGRLTYEHWWLDERYRYNMVPFKPVGMTAGELEAQCLEARKSFYSWSSIRQRAKASVNRQSLFMLGNYVVINAMHQKDVQGRSGLPLGDETHSIKLIEA